MIIKELVLGNIPLDYCEDRYIPISSACFLNSKQNFLKFGLIEYSNSYDNKEDLKNLDDLIDLEVLYRIQELQKIINKKNNFDYSFRFWKILLYPWLSLLLTHIYKHQLVLHKTLEKYNNQKLKVKIISSEIDSNFNSEEELLDKYLRKVEFSEWLYSRLIENTKHQNIQIEYKKAFFFKISNQKIDKNISFKTKLVNKLYRSKAVQGFNFIHQLIFHLLFFIKPKVVSKTRLEAPKQYTSKIIWDIDIDKIITDFCPNYINNIFEELEKHKRNFTKGKLINFSNHHTFKVKSKIQAALASEHGELIISTQHGGHNYASALCYNFGKQIEYVNDYFISWGWSRYYRDKEYNFIDLPSPFLSRVFNKHKEKNFDIILVGTDMSILSSKFDSNPSENYWLEYRYYKEQFITKIKKFNFSDNFYYRPYPKKNGSLEDESYFKKRVKNLKILEDKLHNRMLSCKLLILDHPGTTWNIAMAMNTPMICFWSREHFPFNKDADEFLDKFNELGIYFENPKDAADKVNIIIEKYGDLSKWWHKKEIQDLRIEWMHTYARADKNWFYVWVKALWRIK